MYEDKDITRALQKLRSIENKGHALYLTFPAGSKIAILIRQLLDYLSKKSTVSYDRNTPLLDIAGLETRSLFIEQCFNAIEKNNVAELSALLAEKNIAQFKGWFSSRLYSICASHQSFWYKRHGLIEEKIPEALVKTVEEYIGLPNEVEEEPTKSCVFL